MILPVTVGLVRTSHRDVAGIGSTVRRFSFIGNFGLMMVTNSSIFTLLLAL